MLGRLGLEQHPVDLEGDEARQQVVQDLGLGRLVQVVAVIVSRAAALFADDVLARDRQQALPAHPLAEHRDELVVDRVDRVVLAVGEGVRDLSRQLLRRRVAQVLEQAPAGAAHRRAAVGEEVRAAVAERQDLAAAVERSHLLFGAALDVGVERAAQALVARDDEDQGLAGTGLGGLAFATASGRSQQRMLHLAGRHGGQVLRDLA